MSISRTKRVKLKICTPNSCWYCGIDNPSTVDHVIATNKGGDDSLDNLVLACRSCNSAKRDLSVKEFRFVMSWKKTKYSRTINASIGKKLIAQGVVFDGFINNHLFWFEGL